MSMSSQNESRGWEIDDDFTPHPFDDPTLDISADSETSHFGVLFLIALLGAALVIGTYLLGKYLEPPVVTFNPPPQVIIQQAPGIKVTFDPNGWKMECLEINYYDKILRPLWADPRCRGPQNWDGK